MTDKNIYYSLIAKGQTVLADYNTSRGNANIIALRVLENLPEPQDKSTSQRYSFTQDQNVFHVLQCSGLTFLCLAAKALGQKVPYAFLEEIKDIFKEKYGDQYQEAAAYQYNEEFAPILASKAKFCIQNPQSDQIQRIKGDLDSVKTVLIQNIEKVLDRGELLEVLVTQTDQLSTQAFDFRRQARDTKRYMWLQNVKMYIIIAVSLIFLGIFLSMAACGGITYSGCRSQS